MWHCCTKATGVGLRTTARPRVWYCLYLSLFFLFFFTSANTNRSTTWLDLLLVIRKQTIKSGAEAKMQSFFFPFNEPPWSAQFNQAQLFWLSQAAAGSHVPQQLHTTKYSTPATQPLPTHFDWAPVGFVVIVCVVVRLSDWNDYSTCEAKWCINVRVPLLLYSTISAFMECVQSQRLVKANCWLN